MTQSVIDFLGNKFPKKWYSIKELQKDFDVSRDTIYYWIEKFEVPTFKINNSPFVLRENLINFLIRSDKESRSEERLVGFEFVIRDLEQYGQLRETNGKKPGTPGGNGRGNGNGKGRGKSNGNGVNTPWAAFNKKQEG